MLTKYPKKASAMLWIFLAVIVIFVILLVAFFIMNINTINSSGDIKVIKSKDTQLVLKTMNTGLGNILVNNNGMTLYIFKTDTNRVSNCYGTCAVNWPPLIIDSEYQPIGDGSTGILGEILRSDGTTQVTVNGMPLYTFIQDKVTGDIKGQGLNAGGGLWYVISPSGDIITDNVSIITNSTSSSESNFSDSSSYTFNPSSFSSPKTFSISINNFAFSPDTITIKMGDKVKWTNMDSAPHTIVSDSGKELSSRSLSTTDVYTHIFDRTGTFYYHCSIHPSMKGTIIVEKK